MYKVSRRWFLRSLALSLAGVALGAAKPKARAPEAETLYGPEIRDKIKVTLPEPYAPQDRLAWFDQNDHVNCRCVPVRTTPVHLRFDNALLGTAESAYTYHLTPVEDFDLNVSLFPEQC